MNMSYGFPEPFRSAHLFLHMNAQFSLCVTCFPESSTSDHMGHREMPHVQPTDESGELQTHVLTASVLIHGDRREVGRESSLRGFEQLMPQKP